MEVECLGKRRLAKQLEEMTKARCQQHHQPRPQRSRRRRSRRSNSQLCQDQLCQDQLCQGKCWEETQARTPRCSQQGREPGRRYSQEVDHRCGSSQEA